jgi:hypothetical protein
MRSHINLRHALQYGQKLPAALEWCKKCRQVMATQGKSQHKCAVSRTQAHRDKKKGYNQRPVQVESEHAAAEGEGIDEAELERDDDQPTDDDGTQPTATMEYLRENFFRKQIPAARIVPKEKFQQWADTIRKTLSGYSAGSVESKQSTLQRMCLTVLFELQKATPRKALRRKVYSPVS